MTTPILRAMSQVRIGASESTGPAVNAKTQKSKQKQTKLKQQQLFVLRENNNNNNNNNDNEKGSNANTNSTTAMTLPTGAAGNDTQTAAMMAKNEFNLPMLNTSQELFWYATLLMMSLSLSALLLSVCVCENDCHHHGKHLTRKYSRAHMCVLCYVRSYAIQCGMRYVRVYTYIHTHTLSICVSVRIQYSRLHYTQRAGNTQRLWMYVAKGKLWSRLGERRTTADMRRTVPEPAAKSLLAGTTHAAARQATSKCIQCIHMYTEPRKPRYEWR